MIGQGIAVGRYLLPLMLLLGVIQAGVANRPGDGGPAGVHRAAAGGGGRCC